MKRQNYWIIGALISMSVINFLTFKRNREEEQRTIEMLEKVDDMLEKVQKEKQYELHKTLSEALEDSNKLREQTDKELKALSERMREEKRKQLEDLESEIKKEDEKTRFS